MTEDAAMRHYADRLAKQIAERGGVVYLTSYNAFDGNHNTLNRPMVLHLIESGVLKGENDRLFDGYSQTYRLRDAQ